MAQKKAKKVTLSAKSPKAAKAGKKSAPVKAAKNAKPEKLAVKKAKAEPSTKAKSKSKAAPAKAAEVKSKAAKVAPASVPAEEPKQTKRQAMMKTPPTAETPELSAVEEKSIKKAKKALGRAKQNLAKARAKDFGSKLGKNLINQGMDELAKKWESLHKKSDGIESKPYRMKDSFEERTAIVHKILGWGFVLSNQNDRLEVLFRDGIRYLISNYKT